MAFGVRRKERQPPQGAIEPLPFVLKITWNRRFEYVCPMCSPFNRPLRGLVPVWMHLFHGLAPEATNKRPYRANGLRSYRPTRPPPPSPPSRQRRSIVN